MLWCLLGSSRHLPKYQLPSSFPRWVHLLNYEGKQGAQGTTVLQPGIVKGFAPREGQGPGHSRGWRRAGGGSGASAGGGADGAGRARLQLVTSAETGHGRAGEARRCLTPVLAAPAATSCATGKLGCQPCPRSHGSHRTPPSEHPATCKVGCQGLSGARGRRSGAEVFTLPVVTRPGAAGNGRLQGQGWEHARAGV